VHVVDNAGNWNDQKNSNTNGQPSSFEPVEVEVNEAATAKVLSQSDISGHWDGTIDQPQLGLTGQYSLDLIQTGSDVQGTSKISLGSYYAVMDLSGSISNGVLSFTETGIREHIDPPRGHFILKTADINCIGTPTQSLEGTWEYHGSPTVPCNDAPPGSMSLVKGG
jgi:hypothetical protein